jgi:hypothetical protein
VEEEPDDLSAQAMRDFLYILKESVPEILALKPRGNNVEILVHWKCLLFMVSMLEKEQQENLGQLFDMSEEDKSLLPQYPDGFDSHCHLDRTLRELRISDASLEALEKYNPLETHAVNLVGVVGVFCDPATYPTREGSRAWVDQGVVPVIGYHPRLSSSEPNLRKLEEVLKYPVVAGLGEIGLDRTEDPEKWADQMLTVERILNYLLPEHVLVLHCRSISKLADEAILSMLHLLTAHPYV